MDQRPSRCQCLGGYLPNLRRRVRRSNPSSRAVWVMLPPQSASTRPMCSHSTRSRVGERPFSSSGFPFFENLLNISMLTRQPTGKLSLNPLTIHESDPFC